MMSENTTRKINRRPKSLSRGVTLIEMMVAVLVLSIGLLGIAGLQAATSKYKVNTWVRASSATLVSDLSERIRVNPDVAGSSFATNGVDSTSEYKISAKLENLRAESLAISKNCETTACTGSERATFDILTWRQRVRESMPFGEAWLSGDRKSGFIVNLMWFDKERVDENGTLAKPPECSVAGTETGMAQQSCCPKDITDDQELLKGLRCLNFSFVP
jgi:type IV pilus assembly protein PilV